MVFLSGRSDRAVLAHDFTIHTRQRAFIAHKGVQVSKVLSREGTFQQDIRCCDTVSSRPGTPIDTIKGELSPQFPPLVRVV